MVLVYAAKPDFWPPLHLLASIGSGFHPVEHNEGGAFSWTAESASLRLEGLDRRVAWDCGVRVRGGRPDPAMLPVLTIAADAGVMASARTGHDSSRIPFTIPVQEDRRGVTLRLTASNTFTPATADRRRLGVMVEDIECRPATGIPLPPRQALGRASLAAAILGAAIGLLQLTPGTAVGASVVVAALQAIPLALGAAPYFVLGTAAPWLSLVTAVLLAGGIGLARALHRTPIRNTGRFVWAFTCVVLYLKLLVLLHPEAAAATPAPATLGVLFADRTGDVFRLALAAGMGLLLYPLTLRLLGDRLAAAGSVVLYHLAPGSFGVAPGARAAVLAAPLLVLALIGVLRLGLASGRPHLRPLMILGGWVVLGLVVGSQITGPAPYLLTVYPPLAVTAAAGAAWGWSGGHWRWRLATGALLSGVLSAAGLAWLSRF